MFCPNCGAKISGRAKFCQKCGTKLIADVSTVQPTTEASANYTRQSGNISTGADKKKKAKRLPVILGIVALVILAIILLTPGGEDEIDYRATVRAYAPYAESQGMSYSCGEVFDRYIPDAEWTVRTSDDAVYVDVSGIAKETEKELLVTVPVEIAGDRAVMNSISMKLDGEELTENAFFALFVAYDEKDDSLSHIDELISEVDFALRGGELTGVFTDETTGISFRYPDWWEILDAPSEYEIVDIISPRNNANHITTFNVSESYDALNIFSGDETTVRNSLLEDFTFLDYGDVMLGDIPAKVLRYQTAGLNGDDIAVTFWYTVGEDVYRVACSYTASTSAIYEPIFQAIMESYTIIADKNSTGTSSGTVTSMQEAQGLVENWIVNHPIGGMPSVDGAAANDVDSISSEYYIFELWTNPRDYTGLVYVRKADGYMLFQAFDSEERVSLDDWYAEWSGSDTTSPNDGLVSSPAKYISLVYDGDKDSWITLYQDGTFAMQVNLYVGYGSLSGTYEETDWGFKFYVEERSFSGYMGDDVDEFEMVVEEYGVVEYRGDTIGTTMTDSIYQFVDP